MELKCSAVWALACLPAASGMAAAAAPPATRVHVEYRQPAQFTDAHDASLPELARHIERSAASLLRHDECLWVAVTGIDRAGAFERWRRDLQNVRIIRSVYSPRIELSFRLTASDGAVLKEGQRTLRDAAFMFRAAVYRDDPLRYEKALLDDWLERDLQPRQKR